MWLSEPFVAAIKEGGTKCYTHYKQTCCGYYSRLFSSCLNEYFIKFNQNDEISYDICIDGIADIMPPPPNSSDNNDRITTILSLNIFS